MYKRQVLCSGLAGDGGLFVPKFIPQLNQEILNQWRHLSYEELALEIISLFSGDCFSRAELSDIVNVSYAGFHHELKSPLIKLEDIHYILELFLGPTLAFKDFAMQLLIPIFDYFLLIRFEGVWGLLLFEYFLAFLMQLTLLHFYIEHYPVFQNIQ